jgi:DNA-binding transcriptional LysR family regulator
MATFARLAGGSGRDDRRLARYPQGAVGHVADIGCGHVRRDASAVNPALVARKFGSTKLLLVAAPSYLARMGRPAALKDLSGHLCIRDTNLRGNGAWPLMQSGVVQLVAVNGPFVVNSPRMAHDFARDGDGIALCPDYVVHNDLIEGALETELPQHGGPELDSHAVYLGQRRLSHRTRALLDFLAREPALSGA